MNDPKYFAAQALWCSDGAAMNARTQISLDPAMQRRAQARAHELGISFAEYIRRLVADDLGKPKRKTSISLLFNLVDEGPQTDIARDKDKMIGLAMLDEHQEELRRTPLKPNQPGRR
jgi:hypothetical protein